MRITDPLPLKMRETSRISPGPERIRLSGPGFFMVWNRFLPVVLLAGGGACGLGGL